MLAARKQPAGELYYLGYGDYRERHCEYLEPVDYIQAVRVEYRSAELSDYYLQYEGACKHGEHDVVFEEVFKYAVVPQLARVEGVEELEQHEQREHGRALVTLLYAEEVELGLQHHDERHIQAVYDYAREHIL